MDRRAGLLQGPHPDARGGLPARRGRPGAFRRDQPGRGRVLRRRGPLPRRQALVRPRHRHDAPAREAGQGDVSGPPGQRGTHDLPDPRAARPSGADPGAVPAARLSLPAPLDRAVSHGPGREGRQRSRAPAVALHRGGRPHQRLLPGPPRIPARGVLREPSRRKGAARVSGRLSQALALARDWVAPGEALAQWTHFVTSVCNARCAHCFYPINAGKNELTLEEIDRLTRTLPPIRLLLIGGGEPFLRRDPPEILRLYFERTRFFTCSVPTNGFGPDEITAVTERICGIDPDLSFGVTVSIDGFREYHDFVRRLPGLYDRAVGTLTSLLTLARRTPNLTVGVTTVFMRDNQKDFESFCDYV